LDKPRTVLVVEGSAAPGCTIVDLAVSYSARHKARKQVKQQQQQKIKNVKMNGRPARTPALHVARGKVSSGLAVPTFRTTVTVAYFSVEVLAPVLW
jgi:hypothetical protein